MQSETTSGKDYPLKPKPVGLDYCLSGNGGDNFFARKSFQSNPLSCCLIAANRRRFGWVATLNDEGNGLARLGLSLGSTWDGS